MLIQIRHQDLYPARGQAGKAGMWVDWATRTPAERTRQASCQAQATRAQRSGEARVRGTGTGKYVRWPWSDECKSWFPLIGNGALFQGPGLILEPLSPLLSGSRHLWTGNPPKYFLFTVQTVSWVRTLSRAETTCSLCFHDTQRYSNVFVQYYNTSG